MRELMGPDKPGRARGHGAGVTKSQITKFSYDLRKLRSDALTNHNRMLLDKVESQNKQIESQNKQIESQSKQIHNLEQKVDSFTGELQVLKTAFQVSLFFYYVLYMNSFIYFFSIFLNMVAKSIYASVSSLFFCFNFCFCFYRCRNRFFCFCFCFCFYG